MYIQGEDMTNVIVVEGRFASICRGESGLAVNTGYQIADLK
jgi:hypothetical protein